MKPSDSSNNQPSTDSVRSVKAEIVDDQREATAKQVEALAWLLDESITIPGLNYRIGVDGLLGLVPVVGDVVSAALSMYIVACSHSLGVPKSVLMRMSTNSVIDMTIGSIPVVGDVFDLGWKANKRNVHLLRAHLQNPQQLQRRSRGVVAAFIAGMVAIVIAFFACIAWLVSSL